ncbi:MAG: putative transport system permease protein, partial [Acidimicrobiaceae bacterium]
MLALMWVRGAVGRRRGRALAQAAGIAVTVALLASLGSFLAASKRTMTARAAEHVAVDWQVQLQPGADQSVVLDAVGHQAGVAAALPVGFASTSALSAVTGTSKQTTGAGVVMGIPDGYESTFPDAIRTLLGADNGVLLAQQTAANLHAKPGDTIAIGRTGLPAAKVTVAGVV